MKNCPSSIWCQDSNPRPSERESLPITTRPGLPPQKDLFFAVIFRHPLIQRRAYRKMYNEIGTRTLHIYSVQFCFQDFAIESQEQNRVSPQLSGFVCHFHPLPKHTIQAFIIYSQLVLYLSLHCENNEKINKNRASFALLKKKLLFCDNYGTL